MRNVLETPRASITTGACIGRSITLAAPMLAFGCAITRRDIYARCAQRGIERVREPDSVVLELPSASTLFSAYNALLDQAAALEGLEALVLVHQDAEIVSEDFCAQARRALADPQVGVAGCAGAIGVHSIAWWEG